DYPEQLVPLDEAAPEAVGEYLEPRPESPQAFAQGRVLAHHVPGPEYHNADARGFELAEGEGLDLFRLAVGEMHPEGTHNADRAEAVLPGERGQRFDERPLAVDALEVQENHHACRAAAVRSWETVDLRRPFQGVVLDVPANPAEDFGS